MPGGGGLGDPKTRDKASVVADVRNGMVSQEQARAIYGVGDLTPSSESPQKLKAEAQKALRVGELGHALALIDKAWRYSQASRR